MNKNISFSITSKASDKATFCNSHLQIFIEIGLLAGIFFLHINDQGKATDYWAFHPSKIFIKFCVYTHIEIILRRR